MKLNEIASLAGTYVAVVPTPSTLALLEEWSRVNGVPIAQDLHVTILYSRKCVNATPSDNEYVATGIGYDIFGDALVLKLESQQLQTRHAQFMEMGGTHDYERYNPHLTLQVKALSNLSELPPIDFGLVFHKEYIEPLDL